MNKLDELVKQGWTRRFAKHYLDDFENEDTATCFDPIYRAWAHENGFKVESAYAYGLNNENISLYLSDYDYYKCFPINDWTRIWVNDKLTLKYMLSNTIYDNFMPRYYYYSSANGLRALVDNPIKGDSIDDFIQVLNTQKEFACKPNNGAMARGFVKMSYENGEYRINGKVVGKAEIESFVMSNPNYIYTEYIYPSRHFKRYGNQIHTLRIVTLNERGNNPVIKGGYLRLPNPTSGEANFNVLTGEDTEAYNLLVRINFETGEYGDAKRVYVNRIENCMEFDGHTNISGVIENYKQLTDIVLGIAGRFATLEWLGFDIGVTDAGFKCMEINTLPGIKYMQVFNPILGDKQLNQFFANKIKQVDTLLPNEISIRNNILR